MAIIRTTYHGRLADLRAQNTRIASRLAEAQEQAQTGIRVRRASDDPGLTTRLAALREQHEDQQVYADNAEFGMSLLDRADGALTQMARALSDANELTIQMSSETYADTDRQNVAGLAQGMLDRLLDAANSHFGGRYIFSGDAYDGPAFDAAGTYLGDNGEPGVPVADNLDVQVGWDGSDLLQGTTDIIGAMVNLVANLTGGVADDVQTSIVEIDAALDQVAAARTRIGNEYLVAEDALDLTVSLDIELSEELSRDTEVDMAESYARLFELQTSFEAALQVTASSRTNLLFSRI